jgi:hypothetical protein
MQSRPSLPLFATRDFAKFKPISRMVGRGGGIESTSKAFEVCVGGSRKKLGPTWVQILTN